MAQEGGDDHGDWVGVDRAVVAVRWPLNDVTDLQFSGGVEETSSLEVSAHPSRGSYRPNPSLGAGTVPWLRAALGRRSPAGGSGVEGRFDLEAGSADQAFVRLGVEAAGQFLLGAGTMRLEIRAGLGSPGLPQYRGFALGGRGTLPGEPYRAWGGRRALLIRAEWQVPVPIPMPGLGALGGASRSAMVAPFVSLGASGGAYEGLPWQNSSGFRPVVGVASELLFKVFRIEAGYAPRAGRVGITVDASPDWWPIL